MADVVEGVDDAHEEVGAGETHDEVVAGHVELAVAQHALDDERVADDVDAADEADEADVERVEDDVVRRQRRAARSIAAGDVGACAVQRHGTLSPLLSRLLLWSSLQSLRSLHGSNQSVSAATVCLSFGFAAEATRMVRKSVVDKW